jgi:glutamate racemase
MPKSKTAIGIFDSGYGGLTVLNALQEQLPEYDYIYLGDNARAPYGTRSFEVVLEYTWQGVKALFDLGCELVILACNTASAKALRTIQQIKLVDYPGKRVLGMIRPTAEVIGNYTVSNEIGVFATEGTVKSGSYEIEMAHFFPKLKVFQKACPLWVPLVENNDYNTVEGRSLIKRDVNNFFTLNPNVDTIVLGCTHYPILIPILKDYVPEGVILVSQGEIVAKALKAYLLRHTWLVKQISTTKKITYLTTEQPETFKASVKQIFKKEIKVKQINLV